MKKMKKLFAMLLTLAMVFGMSMTSFAAPAATAKITVKNLTANDNTTLNLYQVVKFNDATSSWEVTDWVKNALKSDPSLVDLTTKPAKIDYAKLAEKYLPTSPNAVKENVNTTSCDFTDLEVGAYLITASGDTTSYTVMGTGTYDYDENSNLIKPVSKEISAKGETYTVVKTLKNSNQTFVIKGETVEFNIDTVFPSYADDNTNRTFTITDTPTGMKVTGVKVSVGGTELTENVDYTISELGVKDKAVTVSFTSDYIGTSNAHAAAAVRVEVTAVVTSDDGTYSNKATSDYDSTPSEVVGTSGSITINKTDDNKTTPNPLTGAKFSIKKGETTLEFVELSAGEYTLYTEDTVIPEGKQKVTNGTLEGDIVPGDITFFRLQNSSDNKLSAYIAQGEVLPVRTRSFGAIGIFAIPEMGRFYRHVLIEGNFPHHGAVAFGHFGKTLFDVFKYIGVENVSFNQPKGMLYKSENPFA